MLGARPGSIGAALDKDGVQLSRRSPKNTSGGSEDDWRVVEAGGGH
jgi:hypothetical protein